MPCEAIGIFKKIEAKGRVFFKFLLFKDKFLNVKMGKITPAI
jgi:hypothetical protein